MVSGWYRGGIGVVSGWYRGGIGVVSGWYRGGIGVVSGWYRGGIGVVRRDEEHKEEGHVNTMSSNFINVSLNT